MAGPLLGGVVYDKAGYFAVFYMSSGLITIDALLRITMIEKKAAAKWLEEPTDSSEAVERRKEKGKEKTTAVLPEENSGDAPAVCNESAATDGQSSSTTSNRLPPILTLLASRRMLSAIWGTLVASAILTSFDSVLPLHVKAIFGVS